MSDGYWTMDLRPGVDYLTLPRRAMPRKVGDKVLRVGDPIPADHPWAQENASALVPWRAPATVQPEAAETTLYEDDDEEDDVE